MKALCVCAHLCGVRSSQTMRPHGQMISGRSQTIMAIQHEDFRLCLIRELNHARKITLLPHE